MGATVFKETVIKEFAFAKAAKNLEGLWQRNISLPSGGCLIPLSFLHLDDKELLNKLAAWREASSYAYPTRFPVTFEGTRKWVKEGVLEKESRILFLVYDEIGHVVGHAGFANGLNLDCMLEVDNVLRGSFKARKGIFAESVLALLSWGFKSLFANGAYLQVLASNKHAIQFYERLGFVESKQQPLKLEKDGDGERLVPANANEQSDDIFIKMDYQPAEKTEREMILTAGPSIGFREQVYTADAVRNGWNTQWNKYLQRFESEFSKYVGTRYAISTSSCTGALHIALMALGIGPGDEVLVPEITWVATANAVLYVGATPVFVDIDKNSWCIDIDSAESFVTAKTKAIIPVHLYGHPCNMDKVLELAARYNLFVVEDAAPSIGAEFKRRRTGSFGNFAAFSFQGAKLAVTGEGGMLVTNDEALYKRALTIWDQGRIPGSFWIETNGLKYKMSNVQAAIGLGQLQRNNEMVEAKRRIFRWYKENLNSVENIWLCNEPEMTRSIYWMTNIILSDDAKVSRDELIAQLKARHVDSRPVFPAISQYPIWPLKQKPNPVAKYISEHGINLPSGVCLSRDQINYVCQQIIEILK